MCSRNETWTVYKSLDHKQDLQDAVEQGDQVRAESIGCNILRESNYTADEKDDSGGREKQTETSIHDILDRGERARDPRT